MSHTKAMRMAGEAIMKKPGIPAPHEKEAVSPGLYAGGSDAGGMFGDSYPIRGSSGLASAFAFNSGRMAGKSVLCTWVAGENA